ncbi:hypothetical protein F4777DRAFT_496303 [Nemania sp. FL0916]|nr:hypothetical protein F4777DRAFT_496303 [Nemania sp. FL0916]
MSLFPGWSLPSRSFVRDKSPCGDGGSTGPSKFSTVHIGQPGLHRRANLSSAFSFSTLLEKNENRHHIQNTENNKDIPDSIPLLAPRRENVPSDAMLLRSYVDEGESIPIGTPSLRRREKFKLIPDSGDSDGTEALQYPRSPRGFDGDTHDENEMPGIHSHKHQTIEISTKKDKDDSQGLQFKMSMERCERICSASSSYPSEGIRSPASRFSSPEPATDHTNNHLAEYRRYGQYPSQSLYNLSSMNEGEASSPNIVKENVQVTLISGDFMSNRIADNMDPDLKHSPLPNEFEGRAKLICPDSTREMNRKQRPSSNSEVTVPILENEEAISSRLEVRFMNYKHPADQTISENDSNDHYAQGITARLTDHPFSSEDSNRSTMTTLRFPSVSDGVATWSTIRDAEEKPPSRSASWRQLFTFTISDRPPSTLSQHIRKLKIRRWVRRVCFKTKARFQLVGRPVCAAKRSYPSKLGRNKWGKRNQRKVTMKTKKSSSMGRKGRAKGWSVGKVIEATKERARQRKTMANHIFGTLGKRMSLQFGASKSEEKNGLLITHKRVRSCPASVGF